MMSIPKHYHTHIEFEGNIYKIEEYRVGEQVWLVVHERTGEFKTLSVAQLIGSTAIPLRSATLNGVIQPVVRNDDAISGAIALAVTDARMAYGYDRNLDVCVYPTIWGPPSFPRRSGGGQDGE